MLSSRMVNRITEVEQFIEREIREKRIADLLDLKAQFFCSLDEAEDETIRTMSEATHQFFDRIRAKGESFFLDRIAYEEQNNDIENQEDSGDS